MRVLLKAIIVFLLLIKKGGDDNYLLFYETKCYGSGYNLEKLVCNLNERDVNYSVLPILKVQLLRELIDELTIILNWKKLTHNKMQFSFKMMTLENIA